MEDFFPELEAEIDKGIFFISECSDFEISDESTLSNWLNSIINAHDFVLKSLNYIFVNDDELLRINTEYLQHDTLTDIITFPYSQAPFIHSDIFISIDRVKENAQKFAISFDDELFRVISHGLLHLLGFGDKTLDEKNIMRQKENEALSLLKKMLAHQK